MRYFTEDEVRQLLTMEAAIEQLRKAFLAYGRGEAQNQPRRRLVTPAGSVLHSMAGAWGGYFGTKIYSTHPKHGAHFTFHLYETATAKPLAQFEANHLGQIRTGAATGLAVDYLSPERAVIVAVIGSGFQARTQVDAARAVRRVSELRVWSRNEESRRAFAEQAQGRATATVEEALAGADIVITATSAKDPVFRGESLKDTCLVCAVGSNQASRREVPADVVEEARIIVDDADAAKIEAGDLLLAEVDWSRVESMKNLQQRSIEPGLTVFKSVGLGLEDVAAAAYVYEHATPASGSAGPNRATR